MNTNPSYIYMQKWENSILPLVSVSCITYNHEEYIQKAIDSILHQKTTFRVEVLVHDDASTDNTAKIVLKYQKMYQNLIYPIYQTENQFSKGIENIQRIQHDRAKGKYYAICEGDDYWTDPFKLQKQFDILEAHPEYGLVHTDCNILYDASGKLIKSINSSRGVSYEGYQNPFHGILIGDYVIRALTVMVRKDLLLQGTETEIYSKSQIRGDLPLWLELSQRTKFHYMDESTAVYRIRKNSVTHQTSKIKQIESQMESKEIRMRFAEKYNVPDEIYNQVKYMYNSVLLSIAFHTNDILLAEKAYSELIGKFSIYKYLQLASVKYRIIYRIVEVVRKMKNQLISLSTRMKKEKI